MISRFSHTVALRSKVVNCEKCKLNKFVFKSYTNSAGFLSGYKPQEVEQGKYLQWIKLQETQSKDLNKPKFSIILPPPNVTGNLHLGHALMCTIQDVICRRKEQQGYNVVWVPGTDHAGIATQVMVEKQLQKRSNLTRHRIGKKAFLKEIWEWKKEKRNNITDNLKKMGCILNWDMEYFTMDEVQANAVQEAFIRLFDGGLIKRQQSLVNWSCALESAISDIEVETVELDGPTPVQVPGYEKSVIFGQLFDVAYKLQDQTDEIVVSTTRPETMLGDVAVAIHPEDERYQQFHDRQIWLCHPFRKDAIPLIYDNTVDKHFGTGAVKITPAHDKNDYKIGAQHGLLLKEVFTEKGTIIDRFPDFASMPRFVARIKIIEALSSLGLLRGIKPHKMNLPRCSRSKDIIEYMLKPQWFLQCHEMANLALEAVKTGQIKIYPENFEIDWYRWLRDSRNWCISRQLWWGHQIPAFECKFQGKSIWVAAKSSDDALRKSQQMFSTNSAAISVVQDSDVLDTWFSSSLLPFSVFKWPNDEYRNSYPLDLMETGHDILFFWVARMAMLGQKLTGQVPFRNILLNGIVCDAHGRKMSKSLGNVVLPEQVIYGASLEDLKDEVQKSHEAGILSSDELNKSVEGLKKLFPNGIPECGTDALRFTLCSHNIKSHFINFDVSECYTNKLFFNKIWQATRFTFKAFEKCNTDIHKISINDVELELMDRWILSRLGNTRRICNQSYESYNFHIAVQALKTFFYSNFCDVYLETTKSAILQGQDVGTGHCAVLSACISLGLQTMAPFTPFLSEELLKYFPKFSDVIDSNFIDNLLEEEVSEILDVCEAIRQLKSQNQITKKHEPKVHLFPQNNAALKLLCKYQYNIKDLTLSKEVILENNSNHNRKKEFILSSTAGHLCSFGITTNEKLVKPGMGIILNKQKLEKLQKDLNKLLGTISSDGYKKFASENVQQKHLERVKQLEAEIQNFKSFRL